VSLIISSICSLVFVGSEVTSLELLDSFSLSEEEFSSLEDFSWLLFISIIFVSSSILYTLSEGLLRLFSSSLSCVLSAVLSSLFSFEDVSSDVFSFVLLSVTSLSSVSALLSLAGGVFFICFRSIRIFYIFIIFFISFFKRIIFIIF